MIKDVNDENKLAVLTLKVKDNQKNYIETTAECLAEAEIYREFHPVGLYWQNQLIGFAMYGYFANEGTNGRVWLDRFMIDASFQGKGLGKKMLAYLIAYIKTEFSCNEIYLSIYKNNKNALSLYLNMGFVFNNEFDVNGEKIMVKHFYS